MSDAPLMNDEAARSPTGEILDQATTPPATTTTSTTETTPTATPPSTESPDGTTVLTKPADGEKKPDAAPAVPEKYEFKAPDGYTLDAKLIDTVTPVFKELGLSQEAAQKLFDIHTATLLEAAKAPQATYEATRAEWQSKVLSDPEIKAYAAEGKTGIDAVKIDIGRALSVLPADLARDFRTAMDTTGAGDNPAFVKAFWKLSQSVIEGRHVAGRGPAPTGQVGPNAKPDSAAKALYPNLP